MALQVHLIEMLHYTFLRFFSSPRIGAIDWLGVNVNLFIWHDSAIMAH